VVTAASSSGAGRFDDDEFIFSSVLRSVPALLLLLLFSFSLEFYKKQIIL
jgi:hypothetical protein